MSERRVLFYYRPGCTECDDARDFLDDAGVPYLALDIAKDEDALHDLEQRWGCTRCATLVIDGEIFAGFHANLDSIRKQLTGHP